MLFIQDNGSFPLVGRECVDDLSLKLKSLGSCEHEAGLFFCHDGGSVALAAGYVHAY
jgi:hypothetical protein